MGCDPGWPCLGVGPRPRPGKEGQGCPDDRRMPRRQGRGCSGSRDSKARRRRGRGSQDKPCSAGARPLRLTCGPSRKRAAATATAAAGAANRWLNRSPLPQPFPAAPDGETVSAHFLSNLAQRPTSLATSVNFNNFIGTRATDRESQLAGSGRGSARCWSLAGPNTPRSPHPPKRVEWRTTWPNSILWYLVPQFPICKMEHTLFQPPFNLS